MCCHIAELVGNSPVIESIKIVKGGYCPPSTMYLCENTIRTREMVEKAEQDCEHFIQIIKALKRGSSLRHLAITPYGQPYCFPHSILKSFRSLLENDNMTMESINFIPSVNGLYRGSCNIMVPTIESINRFLLLNKNGRKDLVENLNAPREDWVNCLAATSHDVIGLHYMLSKNPSICSITPTEPVTPASSTRRKRRANSMSNCTKVARK